MGSGVLAVPKQPLTKPLSAAQVRSHAAKAEEFAEAAVSDLEAGRNIAATSLAIHADTRQLGTEYVRVDDDCRAADGHASAMASRNALFFLVRQAIDHHLPVRRKRLPARQHLVAGREATTVLIVCSLRRHGTSLSHKTECRRATRGWSPTRG
jgi:hypothetical protein